MSAAQAAKPEAAAQPEVAAVSKDTTPLVWQSDPFVRDWMLAGELRDMKVRAVTLGARPLALINDRIVSLNDTISGKRVAVITRDSVVFEFGGQRRSLKIGE
jgi:type II secretory pathway component PulC